LLCEARCCRIAFLDEFACFISFVLHGRVRRTWLIQGEVVMKSSKARIGQSWKITLSVFAVMIALAGCIPSAPEAKPDAAAPVSTVAETAPVAPSPAATPTVQTQSSPPPTGGQPTSTLRINPLGEPNASVAVERRKDGTGFNVRGTFNLEGSIVPNGPGKWKFTGQFSVAEPDFAVGILSILPMAKLGPIEGGKTNPEDNVMIMIDIPVRPPAASAPEGSAKRSVPVSLDIDAPATADFTVSLTQL
jgi:hypothetical protein